MLDSYLEKELEALEQKGLRREWKVVENSQGPKIVIEGKEYLNFCSNNYLGLANNEALSTAAIDCLKVDGLGSGASRLVSGTMKEHIALEEDLAHFKGKEAAIVFNCGYMANVGIISSLFTRSDIIFSDKLNHASIVDGILLSRAEFKRYPHCDMVALEKMLRRTNSKKRKVIITDSVFSMDGDVAPLEKIVALAKKYNCLTMIDEAHAFGVMGQSGKGAAEHFGVENEIDIQMGTLSKAVGSFGACAVGSKRLIDYLRNKARSFIYTTALPPSVIAASRKALEIMGSNTELRFQLWENVAYLTRNLRQQGFDMMQSETPIIPIVLKESERAVAYSKKLFEKGIFISAIRPPTVPQGTARLRLTVTASHTKQDTDYLIKNLIVVKKEIGEWHAKF